MPDIRELLLEAFAAERAEHLAALRAALAQGEAADRREMFRRAHSLKGAARAVEMPKVEALAHQLESELAEADASEAPIDPARAAAIQRLLDAIEDSAGAGEEEVPGVAGAAAAAATSAPARVSDAHVAALARSVAGLGEHLQSRDQAAALREAAAALAQLRASTTLAPADVAAIDRAAAQLAAVRRRADEEDAAIARALGQVEADAERLMLIPAEAVFAGLERMVRELAADAGKRAQLTLTGGTVEADRRVLEGLRDPIRHLLRNAVTHGVEDPAAREAAGKPAGGQVLLAVAAEGGRLTVRVQDDGRGPDLAALRARARQTRRGTLSGEALLAQLFEHGFSTRAEVDVVAGRGVGLAAVAEGLGKLGGDVALYVPEGGGLGARISAPLTVARQALLVIEVAGERLAVPAAAVRRLVRIDPKAITVAEGVSRVAIEPDREPLVAAALAAVLQLGDAPRPASGLVPALVIGAGGREMLLLVDRLAEVRTLVVSDPGALAWAPGSVVGTAVVDGAALLVLAPAPLVAAALDSRAGTGAPLAAPAAAAVARTLLVVDDSITTRTLEKNILEAAGYQVRVAVDGLAGLEALRAAPGEIALVIADVEMPRLDGFGLLVAIRNDPVLANIPVVMMTSRASPEDVRRGLDLGANAYVTKQEFDQGRLLDTVARFI